MVSMARSRLASGREQILVALRRRGVRTIPTTLATILGVLALAGCGGSPQPVEEADPGDPGLAAGGGSASCVPLLEWHDATYWGGQPGKVKLGESLGEATEPGCADTGGAEPAENEVEVFAIEGVDPAVAFATRPDFVFLAEGYVLESPAHPLHELIYGREGSPAPPEERCGNPATAEATAVESAAYGLIFRVTDVAGGDAVFRQTGEREVVFDAETAFSGLKRNGVPYVAAGDRFELRARPCKQGGEITLVADRLTAE
jgi:Family of unknown function (DUF6281)